MVEMVRVPSGLPWFVQVPGEETVVAIETLIWHFAQLLFPGINVNGSDVFRVLGDSDIEIEEEAEDLVR